MSEEEIRIIKSESCPSLSGKSNITYELGIQGEQQFIRLAGNSSGGIFCKDWIPVDQIRQLLSGVSEITSKSLQPLYLNKSANSPGFLLACILHEQLHVPSGDAPQKNPSKEKAAKVKKAGITNTPEQPS